MNESTLSLTDDEIDTILHALGSSHASKTSPLGWRNWYCGTDQVIESLVAKGCMEVLCGPRPQHISPDLYYRVTPVGIEFIRAIGHKVVIS